MDTIRILGLLFNARHGVLPEERTLTQPFEIDVEISRDLEAASESDRLEDTVDYHRVVNIVRDVLDGERCRLLETMAGRILDRLEDVVPDGVVTVRIRKPRAPIEVPFRTVEVEFERTFGK